MSDDLDPQTGRIIRCAIDLHRAVGCGLLESVYHRGLAVEFEHNGVHFEPEAPMEVWYRGKLLGEFFPDFIVENEVIVEVKSVSAHDRVFDAQVLTYMRLAKVKKGLLLNFGQARPEGRVEALRPLRTRHRDTVTQR